MTDTVPDISVFMTNAEPLKVTCPKNEAEPGIN